MDETDRIEIELLSSRLGRMRGMQYADNRKFFSSLLLSVVAIAAAFTVAIVAGWILLVFGLVAGGVTATFAVWAVANVSFLLRWFRGDVERRIAATLRISYDIEKER